MRYRSKRFWSDMAAVPHKVLRDLTIQLITLIFLSIPGLTVLGLMVSGGNIYVSGSKMEQGIGEAKGIMFLYVSVIEIVKYNIHIEKCIRQSIA